MNMNITQTFMLKIGGKAIFHENLNNLNSLSNFNKSPAHPNNNYPAFSNNNSSMNSFNNQKQNYYDNFDILPKFIANQNMQEVNKELTIKILKKKVVFEKMVNTYFSDNNNSFIQNLNEIESEINGQEMAFEYAEKRDYESFKDLISFINANNTDENLKNMQNISLEDYQKLTSEDKRKVYSGIFKNRPAFNDKLGLIGYYNNVLPKKRLHSMSMSNDFVDINKTDIMPKRRIGSCTVTKEQINLFRTFIGNPKIPDSHVLSYFDPINPKVMMAAEKYFRNTYKNDFLTLNYCYQDKGKTKIHKFRFTSEVKELFMAAQDDYMSMDVPRLYTEVGKEIIDDRKIKCIGALNIANNSKIKVLKH